MGILSDINGILAGSPASSVFSILEFGSEDKKAFDIYGVFKVNKEKKNIIPEKPLEGGQFRQDSQNIKPYTVSITGIIVSDDGNPQGIKDSLVLINKYLDGITLLSINQRDMFEIFEPVKLVSAPYKLSVEAPIPMITFTFTQIQVGVPSSYSKQTINRGRRPETKTPAISG